jgi:plasmid stability protein
MKTTLDLPDELVREMKLRAVVQGRTVKALVTELLSLGLGIAPRARPDHPPVSAMVRVGDNGLPVVRCKSKAPATRLTSRELLRLEQETQLEEDLLRARLPD